MKNQIIICRTIFLALFIFQLSPLAVALAAEDDFMPGDPGYIEPRPNNEELKAPWGKDYDNCDDCTIPPAEPLIKYFGETIEIIDQETYLDRKPYWNKELQAWQSKPLDHADIRTIVSYENNGLTETEARIAHIRANILAVATRNFYDQGYSVHLRISEEIPAVIEVTFLTDNNSNKKKNHLCQIIEQNVDPEHFSNDSWVKISSGKSLRCTLQNTPEQLELLLMAGALPKHEASEAEKNINTIIEELLDRKHKEGLGGPVMIEENPLRDLKILPHPNGERKDTNDKIWLEDPTESTDAQ